MSIGFANILCNTWLGSFFVVFLWFGLVLWHINSFRLLNAESSFIHIYQVCMICKHILLIMFLKEPKLILLYIFKWFQILLCTTKYSTASSDRAGIFMVYLFFFWSG